MSLCWVLRIVYCYAESQCADCRVFFIAILNVIMLSFVILSVDTLSVVAPNCDSLGMSIARLNAPLLPRKWWRLLQHYFFSMDTLARGYRPYSECFIFFPPFIWPNNLENLSLQAFPVHCNVTAYLIGQFVSYTEL
jgi:hypothetical protein